MALTITEKILARAAGKESVRPGEIIDAQVDLVMTHDHQGPMALEEFAKLPVERVWDPERVVMVIDHRTPSQSPAAAGHHQRLRAFARQQSIRHFFDCGEGICHDLLIEQGFVTPGMVLVATDSHTLTEGALGAFATGVGSSEMAAILALGRIWLMVPETVRVTLTGAPGRGVFGKDVALELIGRIRTGGADYQALEFAGAGLNNLSLDSRCTVANMALEMGAKNAVFPPDATALQYLAGRARRPFQAVTSDPGAAYRGELAIDMSDLEPLVAEPYSPDKVRPARAVEAEQVAIDQAIIGTCTNGRYEDLAAAASVLGSRRVAPGVRLLIVPATRQLWLRAAAEGLLEVFVRAGAMVSFPCCGPCGAYGMGALAAGETCITTGSRNFIARLGDPSARIYLGNAATVAASAVAGRVVDPRPYL